MPPTVFPPPTIPWQVTGNHWVSIPCVHPVDGSIHAVGVVQRRLRGGLELVGSEAFLDATGPALLALGITVDGTLVELASSRMAWQRVAEWLPTFNATVGDLVVRGTLFAPFGKETELPGFVYALSFENRGAAACAVTFTPGGTLGARLHRVRTARRCDDPTTGTASGDTVVLSGTSVADQTALAIALDGASAEVDRHADGSVVWSLRQELRLAPGERVETAIYAALGTEPDGAGVMLDTLRTRGWRSLAEATRHAVSALEQGTGVPAVDRLVNRHLVFAYFFAVARALDDAQLYLVRSRAPWNGHGLTARDWDALMWTIPAVQLADQTIARELLFRVCELHGYAPGRGVNYIDGTPFQFAFSLDAVAAYPIAVDSYIAHTGDDGVVDEAALADALYAAHDEITAHRDKALALYTTPYYPSGRPTECPYAFHTNVIVAHALDILRGLLDKETAEDVEEIDPILAAIQRHFQSGGEGTRGTFVTATDTNGTMVTEDDPVASIYWLPKYEMLERDDTTYRRTVKRLPEVRAPLAVTHQCARLFGPEGALVLDWLRRAEFDNGVAAELVGDTGTILHNGGDAAISGLIAESVWYAVRVLGLRV